MLPNEARFVLMRTLNRFIVRDPPNVIEPISQSAVGELVVDLNGEGRTLVYPSERPLHSRV